MLGFGVIGLLVFGQLSAEAEAVGPATDYLRPDGDSIDGNWTNELGLTTLYASLNESSPDDATYIRSGPSPVADICKVSLSNPSEAVDLNQPVTVRYRYGKSGPAVIDLRVRLLEGATEIAAWTHSNISASFVTAAQPLTAPQRAAIVNPANLFLEFKADAA